MKYDFQVNRSGSGYQLFMVEQVGTTVVFQLTDKELTRLYFTIEKKITEK